MTKAIGERSLVLTAVDLDNAGHIQHIEYKSVKMPRADPYLIAVGHTSVYVITSARTGMTCLKHEHFFYMICWQMGERAIWTDIHIYDSEIESGVTQQTKHMC